MLALLEGHAEVAKLLLEAGVSPDVKSKNVSMQSKPKNDFVSSCSSMVCLSINFCHVLISQLIVTLPSMCISFLLSPCASVAEPKPCYPSNATD